MENIKHAKIFKSIKYIKKMLYDDSEIETAIKLDIKKVVKIKKRMNKKFKNKKKNKFVKINY
jgi:hypothetical protein